MVDDTDDTDDPPPPAHIEPLVRVLGTDGAIRFLLTFGGAELCLAGSPRGRSRLVQEFGAEVAVALAAVADRLPRRMPLAKEWIASVWTKRGLTDAEIARRLHVTDVTVRAWRKKKPWRGLRKAKKAEQITDPRQLPLI